MRMTSRMTHKTCIEDLKTIKAYYIEKTGGSYPACIDYAIEQLEKPCIDYAIEPQAATSKQLDVTEE